MIETNGKFEYGETFTSGMRGEQILLGWIVEFVPDFDGCDSFRIVTGLTEKAAAEMCAKLNAVITTDSADTEGEKA